MSKQVMGSSARLCVALVAATLASCGGGGGGVQAPGNPAAAVPDGDHLLFAVTSMSVTEFDGISGVSVLRTGDAVGATSINYRVDEGNAENGSDFEASDGVLSWADGETGAKTITFDVYPDIHTETSETFEIVLYGLSGEETVSGSNTLSVEIADSACQQVSDVMPNNATWAGPCYHITDTVIMSAQAQLIIEQGVTVIANANAGISIVDNATIYAEGTQANPVRFKGASPAAGSWNGISIISTNPLQQFNHVAIEGATIGVDLIAGSQLGSFANNSISNTSVAAMRIPTDVLSSLGDGLVFENNPGGIGLVAKTITDANPLTLSPQATHYSYSSSLIVDGKLVLEPGVDLRFGADSRIYISSNGSLNAVGTQTQPIVITGVTPRAGFWNGIQWVSSTSTDNRLAYVTIEYGGGDPARSGNLIVEGSDVNLAIQNSTIANSAGYGLYQISSGSVVTQDNVTYSNNELGGHLIP
ncbi:MAG: Calx-beta domain-containing protein [Granulosicoccaceae bacterium]